VDPEHEIDSLEIVDQTGFATLGFVLDSGMARVGEHVYVAVVQEHNLYHTLRYEFPNHVQDLF